MDSLIRGDVGMEAEPIRLGDVVAGRYRIDRVIGAGGMGQVFAATHVELEQRVAIKVMLPPGPRYAQSGRRWSSF